MTDAISKIGKYEIVSELGRGAMGVVYKGLDPVINRYVAIKTVTRVGDNDAELARRFKQEAVAAGRLNHPSIVAVYEYGEDDAQAFIAMEFVEGSTLSELAKNNYVLQSDEIWALMVKVLDGLDYAHSKGIVHRDIKPANIMRSSAGEIKIADFGIARIESSELTMVGTVIGTPGYMSPEQLLGQSIDHRSDIFSCGVLLYELLTGERAFASTNITSTIYKVVHTSLPPASQICPTVTGAIDPVLAKALAKSPNDRYQSAAEFARDVERVARGEPSLAVVAASPASEAEERTIIRAPLADNDATVVIARAAPTDSGLNKPAAHDDERVAQPDNKPQSATARMAPAAGGSGKMLIWATLGVATVAAVIAALLLLFPGGSDTEKDEAATPPSAAVPAPAAIPAAAPLATPGAPPPTSPGATFKDCESCPEMVVIAPGSVFQGSPAGEAGREANEGPQRTVTIDYPLAVGESAVTRGQFAQFVTGSGYVSSGCWLYSGEWQLRDTGSWQSPGFFQTDDHPVTCVSYADAEAYSKWLSTQTGATYRLLSDSEWEYVARAGSITASGDGIDSSEICTLANVADRSSEIVYEDWQVNTCDDGYVHTAPIKSFSPNAFGVYDMLGNVFEWVGDCWNDSYRGAPTDGSAWLQGDCEQGILRGASWYSMPQYARFAFRNHIDRGRRSASFGFRVARLLK